jgi:hypothetical protein
LFEVQIKSSIRSAESHHYKDSEVTTLFSSTVCAEQVANFVVGGVFRPGDEVTPTVFGLLPDNLDEIEFGTVWSQIKQLHAIIA